MIKNFHKIISLIYAPLLSTIFLLTTNLQAQQQTPSTKKLKIGAVLSLTGPASTHGNAIREGLEFAKSDLQEKGWDIDIEYQDDGTEPKKTILAVQRLSAEGIKYFIGPTWGVLAVPSAPIFKKLNALSLQPCNSSDFVKGVNDRYFFFFTPPSKAKPKIVEFLKQQAGKKVAIYNNISDWGNLWENMFKEAISEAGATLVETKNVQYAGEEGGISSIITSFKQKGINVILSTTTKELTAFTISHLEQQQMKVALLSPDLIDTIHEKLSNTKSSFVEGYTITPISDPNYGIRFENKYGRKTNKYSDSAYDSLITLTTAIDAVGSDTDKISNYLKNTIDLKGYAGRIKFTTTNDIEGYGYEIKKLVELK